MLHIAAARLNIAVAILIVTHEPANQSLPATVIINFLDWMTVIGAAIGAAAIIGGRREPIGIIAAIIVEY